MASKTVGKRKPARAKSTVRPWVRWTKRILAIGAIAMFAGASTLLYLFLQASKEAATEMDSLEQKLVVNDSRPSVMVSADGKVLYRVASENRKAFKLSDVPQMVRDAFIAAEDRRFYSHPGVDMIGLFRIAFLAAREGKTTQGGSTLTMQLAKRMVNGSERSMSRKLKDIALASELEKIKTKDQILELYLRQVYFGEGALGLASAAETYFGKEISELTLGEAAMLARCVRRPSTENPIRDLDRAIRNRDVVLGIMLADGTITKQEHDKAVAEKPRLNTSRSGATYSKPRAQHFVDDMLRQLKVECPDLDLSTGGYRIETTLRMDLQEAAEAAVRQVVNENRRYGVSQGAFVMINSEGAILCEVGGTNYRRSQWNVVSQSRRQPGSSFKPIVYATALATGSITADQQLSNAPIRKKDPSRRSGWWTPQNDSQRQTASTYSLATAMALSINLPAIHTLEDAGVRTVISYAHDTFGIKSPLDPTLPLALGASGVSPIEMAEAYSVFMLRGDRAQPYGITRIIGPDGQVVKSMVAPVIRNVLDPNVCDVMNRLLRGVVENGTAREALDVPNAHGKTGTSSDHRDAWFDGFSDGLVGIGWIGNMDNSPMGRKMFGGKITIDFWRAAMKKAHELGLHRNTSLDEASVTMGARSAEPAPSDAKPDDEPGIKAREPVGVDETPILDPASTPETDLTVPDESVPHPTPPLPDEPTREQPKPDRRRRETPKDEMVEVEVCADTGLRATMYCNETVTRRYRKGSEPKRSCTLHKGEG